MLTKEQKDRALELVRKAVRDLHAWHNEIEQGAAFGCIPMDGPPDRLVCHALACIANAETALQKVEPLVEALPAQ